MAYMLAVSSIILLLTPTLRAQTTVWRMLDNTSHGDCAMTFDTGRARFVAVSGGKTLEWDGSDWQLRTLATPSRLGTILAYDNVRRRTLMFGGFEHVPAGAPVLANTLWSYDGSGWTQLASGGPAARWSHAMAFDSVRGRLVVFGGDTGFTVSGQTWEWNGSAWQLRVPAMSPPARTDSAMAFDASTGRMILFGGLSIIGTRLADTWAWDGTNWSLLLPSSAPTPRTGHRMSADSAGGSLLLFGGVDATGRVTDSWLWNAANWVAGPTSQALPRSGFGMATDASGQTLMLGGNYDKIQFGAPAEIATLGDTWAYSGGPRWNQVTPTGPPFRGFAYMAYDSWRDRIVLAGGSTGTLHYTWEWGNGAWTRMNALVELPPFAAARMCFDAGRGVTVAYGGFLASSLTLNSATWEWDGSTWAQRSIVGPPARYWHSMAYDAARGNIVLFGGIPFPGVPPETWVYDGQAWTLAATVGPSSRYLAQMTYDSARARVVLFGGQGQNAILGDTWEWDGVAWTQRFPAVSPPPRWSAAFGYDSVNARSTMLGGWVAGSAGLVLPVREAWHWNGMNWSGGPAAVPVEVRGPSIDTQALVYHDGLQALLMLTPAFGANAGVSSDLWIGSSRVAAATNGGIGCASATPPRLSALGSPATGNTQFAFEVDGAPANGIVVVGGSIGFAATQLGGGCTLYLQGPLATVVAVANAAGFATQPFPVPASAALVGFDMTVQAAALDSASALGLALTGFLAVHVGI